MKINYKLNISFLLILSIMLSCTATKESRKETTTITKQESNIVDSSAVVYHKAYSLKYNEDHEQAEWVRYTLTKNHLLMRQVPRKNKFKVDTLIKTGSATADDYKKSGYDRGHLAPAADMSWSKTTMKNPFI